MNLRNVPDCTKVFFLVGLFQGKIEAWGSDSAQAKGFPGYALSHFSNVNENKQKSDGTGRELP